MAQPDLPSETEDPNKFLIRPYARLLTMLGEQLIKNERIALAEIVKNAYDADASWVSISFEGFGKDLAINEDSKIIIEDDGYGMSEEVIKKHWLNPATPGKKITKGTNDTTPKGRKIQGEKGIGRFAVLKLGKRAEIVTRTPGSNEEWAIDFDFSKYDDDFLLEDGVPKELFLSDLKIDIRSTPAATIVPCKLNFNNKIRAPHGTRIEITHLKGLWSPEKLESVYKDLSRLQSNFHDGFANDEVEGESSADQGVAIDKSPPENQEDINFDFYIYLNGHEQEYREKYTNSLEMLIQRLTVLKIEHGEYDPNKQAFKFKLNGTPTLLELKDTELSNTLLFKRYFGKKSEKLAAFGTECGAFQFGFYIFDFDAKKEDLYHLTSEDKTIIKSHRIYLYRDNIRVYPYGDQEDDWLRIDALRGTISAGQFLSNDQVVGFVKISQKGNPQLKDKTNREGLIDTGKPHDDFINLLQILLAYLRAKPYEKYLSSKANKKIVSIFKEERVKNDLSAARTAAADNPAVTALIEIAQKNYQAERQYLVQRAETTEDLAGVGLSVETASHDIQSIMGKAMGLLDMIIKKVQISSFEIGQMLTDLTTLRGMFSFVETQLKDIQLLFKSSKQRRRDIRVQDVIEKVHRIYLSVLDSEGITLEIISLGSPLVAKTTDAVLLQVLINLFDNAIYWLENVDSKTKKIEIRLDGDSGSLFFSDNGPGIRPEDVPFIFEPFFSGKGEAGRGLGLYIARQLLERHEYSIDLTDLKANQYLPGANFVVSFTKENNGQT